MKLDGHVALVTGASKGIGAAIAIEAARAGADVVINYAADRQGAEETLAVVTAAGRRGIIVQADVSRKAEVDAMVARGIETFDKIDILVNNSGIALWKPFLEIDEANWDRTIDVNLKSVFLCSQAVARRLVAQGLPGSIINIL